jgi:hypothetical protein
MLKEYTFLFQINHFQTLPFIYGLIISLETIQRRIERFANNELEKNLPGTDENHRILPRIFDIPTEIRKRHLRNINKNHYPLSYLAWLNRVFSFDYYLHLHFQSVIAGGILL